MNADLRKLVDYKSMLEDLCIKRCKHRVFPTREQITEGLVSVAFETEYEKALLQHSFYEDCRLHCLVQTAFIFRHLPRATVCLLDGVSVLNDTFESHNALSVKFDGQVYFFDPSFGLVEEMSGKEITHLKKDVEFRKKRIVYCFAWDEVGTFKKDESKKNLIDESPAFMTGLISVFDATDVDATKRKRRTVLNHLVGLAKADQIEFVNELPRILPWSQTFVDAPRSPPLGRGQYKSYHDCYSKEPLLAIQRLKHLILIKRHGEATFIAHKEAVLKVCKDSCGDVKLLKSQLEKWETLLNAELFFKAFSN